MVPSRGNANHSRRHFLTGCGSWVATAAFADLLSAAENSPQALSQGKATAKRVIFLHQAGAPSQLDLFDPKPQLEARHGSELPASVRGEQRLTSMTADQKSKPVMTSPFAFRRYAAGGMQLSELLPFTGAISDQICLVRSMVTDAINHDPAMTLLQTGSQQPGRPSFGAWTAYGLGSVHQQLPTFTVMVSGGEPGDQPLFGRLWSSGFLPSQFQGVKLRSVGDPVLYLSDPPGIDRNVRRTMLDSLYELNRLRRKQTHHPAVDERIRQFELAYQMQTSVPELVDFQDETEQTLDMYGADVREPGSFAANCLLARRLVERGVKFVQLYHRGWDHHLNLRSRLRGKCQETDQPAAALVSDLHRRGLLEETLVVWAGEFGRTVYCQGPLDAPIAGRDHHPGCFSVWLAGGGIKPGIVHGSTDDFSYHVAEDPVHVHDLHATLLHCLGFDHEKLTYLHEGRHHRLTDVAGRVIEAVLA